jgi:hypothetical protein
MWAGSDSFCQYLALILADAPDHMLPLEQLDKQLRAAVGPAWASQNAWPDIQACMQDASAFGCFQIMLSSTGVLVKLLLSVLVNVKHKQSQPRDNVRQDQNQALDTRPDLARGLAETIHQVWSDSSPEACVRRTAALLLLTHCPSGPLGAHSQEMSRVCYAVKRHDPASFSRVPNLVMALEGDPSGCLGVTDNLNEQVRGALTHGAPPCLS